MIPALLALGIGIPLLGYWKGGSLFSPWSLYSASQFGALAFALLKLHPAMNDPSPLFWLAFFGSASCFYLGCWIARLAIGPSAAFPARPRISQHFFLRAVSFLQPFVLIGFSYALFEGYRAVGGWPTFMRGTEDLRLVFADTWFLSEKLLQLSAWIPIASLTLLRWPRGRRDVLLGWAGIGLIAWAGIASGMRVMLFPLIIGALVVSDLKRRIRPAQLTWVVLATLILFSVIFLMRQSFLVVVVSQIDIEFAKMIRLSILPVYVYVANNFWNFDHALQLENSILPLRHGYGFMSGYGVLYFTHFTYFLDHSFTLLAQYGRYLKIPSLNTFPYQWCFYFDFGWIGIFLGAFGFGGASTIAFLKARTHPGWMIVNTLCAVSVALSFFAFLFSLSSFGLVLILVGILAALSSMAAALEPDSRNPIGESDPGAA